MDMDLIINKLPSLTWNRLGMNETTIHEVPTDGWSSIKTNNETVSDDSSDKWNAFNDISTGMGEDIDKIAELTKEDAIRISSEKTDKTEKLHFQCDGGKNTFRDIELLAEEGSSMTVIMDMCSDKNASGCCALRTRMKAEKGAFIRLVQVNLLGKGYKLINDVGVDCADDAHAEIVQLFLGGSDTWTGCKTTLSGNKSKLDIDVGYYCEGEQSLDMNYVAGHKGKKTTSRMDVSGVLKDASKKMFRGTIDFPFGASGAKGDETEDVLILGDDVVNRTIPLILCAEEDVEGNHGASIGRPGDDVLFYLAARGLSEQDACNLLARAKLEALAKKIGDPEEEETVQAYLEEVTGYGK